MRVALTYNVRLTDSEEEAEFDSPETIDAIARTLERAGHLVERVEVTGPASRLVAHLEAFAPDLIFNAAEGRRGKMRRAFYPALFEELGIPYTGSDSYTLCVTLDKAHKKRILAGYGIPSPRARLVTRESLRAGGLDDFAFPVIAKPNFEGSSKGITQRSVADDAVELGRTLDHLLGSYPEGILVERFVPGTDVRVIRLDGVQKLAPVEMAVDPSYTRKFEILDYALKHEDARFVNRLTPPRLPAKALDRLDDLSARAFDALGMRDLSALDFRVGLDGEIHFLSAAPLPSLEAGTAVFVAAANAGLDFDDVIHAMVRAAATRTGLLPLLDATKPRPKSTRRTSLRVGLAFNMKRIDSHDGDDREAEYDAPHTIQAIGKAIESHGHVVVPLEATPDFPRTLMASNVDIVFNIAEGISGRNREAQVPNLCELLGVPYTGSDSATLSICLDKGLSKRMLKEVDTANSQVLMTGKEKLKALRYPVIVKPNQEGTSKGITPKSVVDDEAGVRERARELIVKYGQPALVEEYIEGREFTVGLLGERRPRVLPPMEVVFLTQKDRPVYDYTCKQDCDKHVRYEVPAKLTKDELRAIERVCRATFMTLGCRDVARIDLRMTNDGKIYVIEVNPLPGLTPDYSDLCLISNGAKIEYRTLIGEILSGAIKRWREKEEGRPAAAAAPPPPETTPDLGAN
jgi:D-alanine-D-alanine ligase